jgi:hypothetical protein
MPNGSNKKDGAMSKLWGPLPRSEADKEGDFDGIGMQEVWYLRINDMLDQYQDQTIGLDMVATDIAGCPPLLTYGQRQWRLARNKPLNDVLNNFALFLAQELILLFEFTHLPEQVTTLTLALFSVFVKQIELDDATRGQDAMHIQVCKENLEASRIRLAEVLELIGNQTPEGIVMEIERRRRMAPQPFEGFVLPTMQQEGRLEDGGTD